MTMRLACPEQRLDCLPIPEVKLNLNCRDEIIPILRALQHVYEDAALRRDLLSLVGKDINQDSSRKHGRRGLNYWEITVLAATRLGCNLDYDKLQDLAENHRSLRQIMGIGDWQTEEVDFDWRRIEDNVRKLRPETLKKIDDLIVGAGHELEPKAIESVRGDTFVVETNIHHPTESSLIGDGLRKVVTLAAQLAADHDFPGWRQHDYWLDKIKKQVRDIGRASRAKSKEGPARVRAGYKELLQTAEELLSRGRELAASLQAPENLSVLNLAGGTGAQELLHYVDLTTQVCDTARRRVLEGETVPNEDKIFSIFEPHTELIKRGKQPVPIQYGHNVLVIEDAVGFVVDYRVVANGVLDQDLVVPVMRALQKRFHGQIQSASFDRAFHTPENQQHLAEIVRIPCIASKGQEKGRQQQKEGTVAFRKARQHHPG
ncbi:MAG TPA: ISNCY family transposase, partial [Candidatus Dormibacteraeota bacterium]|nr:ISNCY family transposase [Candidatus Dormibacteraeota bacterium]